MELKETNHSYHCCVSNYYASRAENYGRSDYDTWNDFKEGWRIDTTTIDDDYNHVFRFDIREKRNDKNEPIGEFELLLYFILQRKGIFRPVWIKNITKEDMDEIEQFLKDRWEYLKGQWEEFSR